MKIKQDIQKLIDELGDDNDYSFQYAIIRDKLENIKFIKNPNYEILKTVIFLNGDMIKHIDERFIDDNLRLFAIMSNGLSVRLLKNPTSYESQIAVESNGMAIKYVKNPDIDLCKLALVKTDGIAIGSIKKPNLELQLLAIDLIIERSTLYNAGEKTLEGIVKKITDFYLLLRLKKFLNNPNADRIICKSKYWKDDANLALEIIDSD